MPELSESQARAIMADFHDDPQRLIAILLDIQEASGANRVEKKSALLVSETLGVPLTRIYEILTFYSMFSLAPRGKYLVEACESAPCHFDGGETTLSHLADILGVSPGETTADGLFTLEKSACFGACGHGGAFKIGDEAYRGGSRNQIASVIRSYRENSPRLREGLAWLY
ncbi:MAG: NAD(P)H-dependent oxidoreductase subunit E [Deltaproteobacteria bacterium]|jgi:NADH:ubiquinone oxidoreductase subunit E|nr:NAD(P)H-dependent oxidoreductase subunit E [Deltaproteobacteria bacterium]